MSSLHSVPPFQTKEEYVYNLLREAILNGRFAPGERLVMDHLSKELGVSPIPIRGALQRLQTEGLVEITPHSGAVVSRISREEISEIFLLLEALEELAFRQAAEHARPNDLDELRVLLVEMDEAARIAVETGDVEPWANANDRFHRAVAALSGMKLLTELTGRALDQWARLRRSFQPTFAARIKEAQEDHRRMVDMLAAGDASNLAALAVEHNRNARRAYESANSQSNER